MLSQYTDSLTTNKEKIILKKKLLKLEHDLKVLQIQLVSTTSALEEMTTVNLQGIKTMGMLAHTQKDISIQVDALTQAMITIQDMFGSSIEDYKFDDDTWH